MIDCVCADEGTDLLIESDNSSGFILVHILLMLVLIVSFRRRVIVLLGRFFHFMSSALDFWVFLLDVASSWRCKRHMRLECGTFQVKCNRVIWLFKESLDFWLHILVYRLILLAHSIGVLARVHKTILVVSSSNTLAWVQTRLYRINRTESLSLVSGLVHGSSTQNRLDILWVVSFSTRLLGMYRGLVVQWGNHSPIPLLSLRYFLAYSVEGLAHPSLLRFSQFVIETNDLRRRVRESRLVLLQ